MNQKTFTVAEKLSAKTNLLITTKQLIIVPLTYSQLIKYVKFNSLEKELNLKEFPRIIPNELREALENTIMPNVADTNRNYLYSTLWTAILKVENKMIGELCMMGEPNADGEVEIGYGIYSEYQNNGYMTEFLGGIVEWLKSQTKVKSILACTEKSNISSYRVLEKNGFLRIEDEGNLMKWKFIMKSVLIEKICHSEINEVADMLTYTIWLDI
jgi:predicted acetyltransferase